MDELKIEEFSPMVADIKTMVEYSKGITISDFTNKAQIKLVTEQRKKLRDIRTSITKQSKTFRQKAVDFNKAVIAKEKELIALVEPEEERLKVLEEKADQEKLKADRVELLPKRYEKLATIGDKEAITDDELLSMDSATFDAYYNKRVSAKNNAERAVLDAEKKKHEEELAEFRRKEDALATEAKRVADQKEWEAKEEERRKKKEEADKKEAEDRKALEEQEKKDAEARRVVEEEEKKAKLAANKMYTDWLTQYGYVADSEEFVTLEHGDTIFLYKKLGEFHRTK